jgi:hypothetical protein
VAAYLDVEDEGRYYRHALDLLSIQAASGGKARDLLAKILRET